MLERKHKGILSLNLKKLANRVDDLKIILILQNEMLLLMLFCKLVLKQRKTYQDMATVCSNIFCENCSIKNTFMHLSTKVVGEKSFFNTSFR